MFDRTFVAEALVTKEKTMYTPRYSTSKDATGGRECPPRYFETPTNLKSTIRLRKSIERPRLLSILLIFLAAPFMGWSQNPNLDSTKDEPIAAQAFDDYFEMANVGNLHLWSSAKVQPDADYPFQGEMLPRGLYGLFAENWREDLPKDFDTYAVYKIKNGAGDAYILRFSGPNTYNMLGLFELGADDKLHFLRTLATYHCGEGLCVQMDSWIQDFNGDTRLDILQKSRVMQYTLMNSPTDTYAQVLRQQEDGSFQVVNKHEVDLSDYDLKTENDTE